VTDRVLRDLFELIEQRKAERPPGSYTVELLDHEKGKNAVLEKMGEELTELVLAAKDGDDEALANESADLVYHLLVLLAMHELALDDLIEELQDRR
jgi:phosphoribosyl-ATP pyrophosphohydrolase